MRLIKDLFYLVVFIYVLTITQNPWAQFGVLLLILGSVMDTVAPFFSNLLPGYIGVAGKLELRIRSTVINFSAAEFIIMIGVLIFIVATLVDQIAKRTF